MFEKVALFPEILYRSRVEVTEQQRDVIWDVYNVSHWTNIPPYEHRTDPFNATPYSTTPDYISILVERAPELISILLQHARTYMEDCLGAALLPEDRLAIKYIGCIAVPSKGSVPAHSHLYNGPSFMTGSLCLDNGGDNSPIVLQGPRYNDTEALQTKFLDNTNEHYLRPEQGDLYIWQSHLSHGVPFNSGPRAMVFLWYDVEYIRGRYPLNDVCVVRGS